MIARDLMTPNPVTVTPQPSIAEAWDVIRDLAVRHVPVVQNGVLVGMLSDRDLPQPFGAGEERVAGVGHRGAASSTQILTSGLVSPAPVSRAGRCR